MRHVACVAWVIDVPRTSSRRAHSSASIVRCADLLSANARGAAFVMKAAPRAAVPCDVRGAARRANDRPYAAGARTAVKISSAKA